MFESARASGWSAHPYGLSFDGWGWTAFGPYGNERGWEPTEGEAQRSAQAAHDRVCRPRTVEDRSEGRLTVRPDEKAGF